MVSKWGGAASGALGGAATGATIGSAIPGVGTALGAGVGALGGALSGYLGAEPSEYKQLATKTPEQQRGLSQIYGQLNQMSQPEGNYGRAQNYLSSILQGGPEGFNNFSQPYLQQFEQQILPRLAERFAGLGGGLGGGVGSSSGFGQAIGGAGANLQSQLAQLYQSLQQNAAGQSFNQYNQLSNTLQGNNQFENIYNQGNLGVGGALLQHGAQQFGQQNQIEQIMKILQGLNLNPSPTPAGTL